MCVWCFLNKLCIYFNPILLIEALILETAACVVEVCYWRRAYHFINYPRGAAAHSLLIYEKGECREREREKISFQNRVLYTWKLFLLLLKVMTDDNDIWYALLLDRAKKVPRRWRWKIGPALVEESRQIMHINIKRESYTFDIIYTSTFDHQYNIQQTQNHGTQQRQQQ